METTPVPKAELHCHLIGVIDEGLLRRISSAGHIPLVKAGDVLGANSVSNSDGFLSWLESLGDYRFAPWESYLPILEAHVENLNRQNVVYTEMTISPTMFPGAFDERLAAIEQFVAASARLAGDRLEIAYLFVVPRRLPDAVVEDDTRLFLAAARAGYIAGVAVAGMDYDPSLERLFPMLRKLKDAGLGIEIHSGEHTGPEEVSMILDSGLADRIGHGIRAFEDGRVVDRLRREQVHLEFCPTSNLRTGVVRDVQDLPLARARDLGLNFSINTDDPGAFGCTMDSEFELAANVFGFERGDFEQVYRNCMVSRFSKIEEEKLNDKQLSGAVTLPCS